MKKLLNYAPLHFVLFLILGIIFQFLYEFQEFGFFKLMALIFVITLFLWFINNKKVITFLSFVLFFLIGILSVYINNDVVYKSYYKNFINDNSTTVLKINKVLKSGIYYDKYEVEVLQIDSLETKGKVLLNINKDSLSSNLSVDEIIYVKTKFKELVPPLNPYQFDYKFYLLKKGIHQQIYLQKSDYKSLGFDGFSLRGYSAKFRDKVIESLYKYNFEPNELAVVNALLLGQRQDISKDLITDYSKAGAIHILAVSGLHVGVILLILSFIFKPLERLIHGKIIKAIIIILILWMFAFVAGLSASVVRAVTMFTFLAIGNAFKRRKVTEFSLISSMFFLLLIKPIFLFDVGFQLSYLAVFGIVWVQPKLYKIWKPTNKAVDYFWQLVTVSIAAQVGILPLSIYYFHQFPGLFILSNLVIIPFLGTILIMGIMIILLALLGILPQFLASIYGYVIYLMNSFVSWISHQEEFLFKDISLSFIKMLAWYCVLLFGIYFLMTLKSKKLVYFLGSIFFLQGVYVFENHQKNNKKEFIVFHKSRKSILGIRNGDDLKINHNLDTLTIKNLNLIKTYAVGENIKPQFINESSNIINFKNKNILVVDSLGIYQVKGLNRPIVILQNSPKINLARLVKTINPIKIIADGSNYKSYVKRWGITSDKLKTPFHYTGEKGSFIH